MADIASTGSDGAGAITAALFLQEFVQAAPRWVHMDVMAYNSSGSPGRPEGGEAQALRALWRFVCNRYGSAGPTAAAPQQVDARSA